LEIFILIAVTRLSRIIQIIKNAMIDGTVTIVAIIVPFNTISLILSLDFIGSDNRLIFKNGNKNQRYFIFGGHRFVLLVKLQKDVFK